MTMQANEQAPAAGLDVPDEIARTIRGLLEAAIAGTKSTIRTRDYHGLRAFATTEEEWLARYDAALQWLETAPAQPQPAETWRPMPDGTRQWSEQEGLIVRGKQLEVLVRPRVNGRLLGIESVEVILPDDLALCQRATQPHSAGVPETVRQFVRDTIAKDREVYINLIPTTFISPARAAEIDKFDAALAWLDAQRPGARGEGD